MHRFRPFRKQRRSLAIVLRLLPVAALFCALAGTSAFGSPLGRTLGERTAAPRLVIVKHPAAFTRSTAARLTWKSSIRRTVCRRDGRRPRLCDLGIRYRQLAEGQHTFSVTVSLNGSTKTAKTKWFVDRTAPSMPVVSGGSASWVTTPTVVSATGATDAGSGVAGYQYRQSLDSGMTWSPAAAGATDTVTSNGTTWLQFRTVDKAGNVSSWAPAALPDAASTVKLDNDPPSLPVLTGGGAAWTNAAQVDVVASGSVDALSGLIVYEFATSADGGASWTAWAQGADVSVVAEGQTLVRFRTLDALGNASAPVQTVARIDRTEPTLPVVSGGSDSWVTTATVSASGSTDTGSGVAGYEHRLSTDAGVTWSSPSTGGSVSVTQDGTSWLQFRAVDGAGNSSPWAPSDMSDASATVRLDATPPTVPTLSGGSDTWLNLAEADVTASGSVDVLSSPVSYQYQTSTNGGATWSGWTAGAVVAVTSEGQTLMRFRSVDALGNTGLAAQTTVALDRTAPTVALTGPANGSTVSGTVAVTASAADAWALSRVEFLVDGVVAATDTDAPYAFNWDAGSGTGSHTLTARAVDGAGNQAASAAVAVTVGSAVTTFATLPSGSAGLPRSDSSCASQVTTDLWEPRPDNYTANATIPAGTVAWSNAELGAYWSRWIANRDKVTGNYTGTTNQIIQWGACKWGLDENLMRAVAVQESDWHMSMVGDNCGVTGRASYGLFQIKNAYCSGSAAWGGYPATALDTALNADFYGAYLRSCIDNDFYDGGSWLYNGQTIAQITAAHGFDYAVWGCVGSWYSGGWYDSGAQTYISGVKAHLANKDWLAYGR